MIVPFQKDDVLSADIREHAGEPGFRIWWLGQSGFLLQHEDRHLLFDPYLSDSLTVKYAQTDKPHVRMTELAIEPEKLDFIDVVTSSHNHTDHLDAETLLPLFEVNPEAKLLIPEANRQFVKDRLGCDDERLEGFTSGVTKTIGGFEVIGVPAAHDKLDVDDQHRHKYMGYIVKAGGMHIYHSGDTMMYEGMAELLKAHHVDIALLPINGKREERRVAGNLFGDEAAKIAKAIGAFMVIPCHYEMFEFNTETTELFETTCREIGQPYRVLRCGEAYAFTPFQG